jgi:hypothetical protein
MELEIKETIEHEDGSATLLIDMDEETKRWLINKAIIDCIKQGLVEVEKLHNDSL